MLIITALAAGCKEEGRLDQIDDAAPAPAAVTLKGTPVATPGGAVIKYTVPNDENLLGVKAVYERSGQICETKASIYTDSLTLEGFSEERTYEVSLYSVGRNGKLSEPVSVQITPLTPPFRTIQMDMEETFGGVYVSLMGNLTNASFALVLMADTIGNGDWIELRTFYTNATSIKLARRQLDSRQYTFALYARDRWNNMTDTITKSLTPIEETEIPKDKFSNPRMPGDCFESIGNNNNFRFDQLWDGRVVTDGSGFFASASSYPVPQHFTINLGRKVVISRFQVFPRGSEIYSGDAPRTWELWGSDDPPTDGSWDNWHLLGSFHQLKPSGYGDGASVGPITAEDTEYFRSGGDYELQITDEIPNPFVTISHIRFKTTATFATYGTETKTTSVIIGELSFFGRLVEEE
jgi:hypothetical protein